MTIEHLANIAEVVGFLAVAITLIFLTVQMRQNTKALRSTAAQNSHEMAVAIYHPLIGDADVADLQIRGMRDPSTLTEVETARFTAIWQNTFFMWQNWFYQWQEGVLDDGIWSGFSRIVTDIYQMPGIRDYWQHRRHYFSDEFRVYLETELFTREPSATYRLLGIPQKGKTGIDTGE